MLNKINLVGKIDWFCESKKSFQIIISERDKEDLRLEIYTSDKIYNTLISYCKSDDVVAVLGSVEKNEEQELIIKCEKVSFLTSKNI